MRNVRDNKRRNLCRLLYNVFRRFSELLHCPLLLDKSLLRLMKTLRTINSDHSRNCTRVNLYKEMNKN